MKQKFKPGTLVCLLGYPAAAAQQKIYVYTIDRSYPTAIRRSMPDCRVGREQPGMYLGELTGDDHDPNGWNSIILFGDMKTACQTADVMPYKITG